MIREDRFYVYQHRLVRDGSVFYVGNGTCGRKTVQAGRSKKWKEIVKDNEWYSLVVKDNLTKLEAEELEISLISICKPIANVRTTSIATKALNTAYIDANLCYDETSPSFLSYKVNKRHFGNKERKTGVAGCLANFRSGQRYVVGMLGVTRLSYRVVWYLCTGEDPVGFLIDHIDGDTLNNKITNLRKVCHMENARNTKMPSSSVTGYRGVSFTKEKGFKAQWNELLVPMSKVFSVSAYGEELALALAIEYRHRMVTKQSCMGSPLTERHTGVYTVPLLLSGLTEKEINYISKYPPNRSCITGLRFLDAKMGTTVTSRKIIGSSEYTKSFNIRKLGLLEAIAMSIRWRKNFKVTTE